MNKIFFTLTILYTAIFAVEIPIQKVTLHSFSESKKINAKIIQLSNAQEMISSTVSGHLEKYFVKPAQLVKKGDKIALIESMDISRMSAEYLSLKQQLISSAKNYEALKQLYAKGMSSMSELNNQSIQKNALTAKLNAVESQLKTLGIKTDKLIKATPNFILYAHSSGKVSALLKPLHSSIDKNEPLVTISTRHAYYIKSYLPLKTALNVRLGDKLVAYYGNKKIQTHITQIMPKVDEETQRVIVLSKVDKKVENLFINTYVEARLYFGKVFKHPAVEKSALSFFNNEWVVFVPNEHHADEEQEREIPFTLRVLKIITQDEDFVAVDGLELKEEYVSDKSYYVKSMLLKSSLSEEDE